MHTSEDIQNLLERHCAEGRERGIQVTAYHRGIQIVNAWAGVADQQTGSLVRNDTLFPVFSVTKGWFATVIHVLVDRGVLSYVTRIAEVWPEFGAHGKEAITIDQVMRHRAGLTKVPAETSLADTLDWQRICGIVAASPLEWEPGTRCEYHALTYGWILGEVARRATGKMPDVLLQEIVKDPLGIESMVMGMTQCDLPIARIEDEVSGDAPKESTPQAVPKSMWPLGDWINSESGRSACLPAGSGMANADAIARHYAALLADGVDGVALLSPERIAEATDHTPLPGPPTTDYPDHFGRGYALGLCEAELPGLELAFGHGGHGGSMGFADRKTGLAFGMTRNRLQAETPLREIVKEVIAISTKR